MKFSGGINIFSYSIIDHIFDFGAQGAVEAVLRSFLLSQRELRTLSTAQRKVSQVRRNEQRLRSLHCWLQRLRKGVPHSCCGSSDGSSRMSHTPCRPRALTLTATYFRPATDECHPS